MANKYLEYLFAIFLCVYCIRESMFSILIDLISNNYILTNVSGGKKYCVIAILHFIQSYFRNMKQLVLAFLILFTQSFNTLPSMANNNNQEILAKVKKLTQQFDKEKDPELLRVAYQKLEGINLNNEPDQLTKTTLRKAVSELWIKMLNQIDENINLDFDPEKTIVMQPPVFTAKNGQQYTPIDLQTIKDSADKVAYIKILDAHEKAQSDYQMQLYLKQMNEQIPPSARKYFVKAYPENDRIEIKLLVKHSVKSKARQKELLAYFK